MLSGMRPRVLVDLRGLENPHSGIGRFSHHLATHLPEAAPDLDLVYLVPREGDWPVETLVPSLWRRPRGIDLWHSTFPALPRAPKGPRLVVTVHDLLGKPPRLDRADAVAFVSEWTAREAGSRPLPARRLVIPNGPGIDPGGVETRPAFLPEGPFLFSLGEFRPRKNFHLLPALLGPLPGLRLVIAGQRGIYPAYDRKIVPSERVLLPGPVAEAEKVWLYRHCEAFLFPSRAEGFGMPVLEALLLGCPVVAARLTSLPEVGGDLARYWDSLEDPEAMADVVRSALGKPPDPRRVAEWTARFTWPAAARAYADLYRAVLG